MGFYDEGLVISYNYPAQDFGAGNATRDLIGPAGKRGRIRAVSLIATEAFNSVTTEAFVRVGTAADDDAYLNYAVGDLAAGSGATPTDESGLTVLGDLPADTEARISFIAPTGGTPTGIADTVVVIEWY